MEHSAVLLTCIKLPHGLKTFVLSIFKWLLKTGFTVLMCLRRSFQNTIFVSIISQLAVSALIECNRAQNITKIVLPVGVCLHTNA